MTDGSYTYIMQTKETPMTIQNRVLSVLGILALVGCNDPQVDPGSAATVRGSITEENFTTIPFLERKGVMIK